MLTFDDAVGWLRARLSTDRFSYVVTPNVDHLVRLDNAFDALSPLYSAASLRLCDSRVVSRLAQFVGAPLPAVPGSDLVVALLAQVVRPGDKIAVVGSTGSAIKKLSARYPELDFHHLEAPMGLRDKPEARSEIIASLRSLDARFVLIAVGSPQQEMLAFEMQGDPDLRGTALCIGASIDFIVRVEQRAPKFIQRRGLEWAWRLSNNPRKLWRRYLIKGPLIFYILFKWCSRQSMDELSSAKTVSSLYPSDVVKHDL